MLTGRGVLDRLARCAVFAAAFVAARPAEGCSCPRKPPCVSFDDAPVVFVGLVTSIEETPGRSEVRSHFRVEEALRGIRSKLVDLDTGPGRGDCGYAFKSGKRYLVYASPLPPDAWDARKAPGGRLAPLTTGVCDRTRPLAEAGEDLDFLRARDRNKALTRVFGYVQKHVEAPSRYPGQFEHVGPIEGWTVVLDGERGHYETRTDASGRFGFPDPPSGQYSLSLQMADGFKHAFIPWPIAEKKIVERVDVASAPCAVEKDFHVQSNGRIGGQVFDRQGNGVRDLQVSLVPLESAPNLGHEVPALAAWTTDGQYEFVGVPAGRYVVGVNLQRAPDRDRPYAPTYHPSAADWKQAAVLNFSESQVLPGIDIRLPAPLVETTIRGEVVRRDGRGVERAALEIRDAADPTHSLALAGDVVSDAQGRFELRCFLGRRYRVRASFDGTRSDILEVDANGLLKPVRVVVPAPRRP